MDTCCLATPKDNCLLQPDQEIGEFIRQLGSNHRKDRVSKEAGIVPNEYETPLLRGRVPKCLTQTCLSRYPSLLEGVTQERFCALCFYFEAWAQVFRIQYAAIRIQLTTWRQYTSPHFKLFACLLPQTYCDYFVRVRVRVRARVHTQTLHACPNAFHSHSRYLLSI